MSAPRISLTSLEGMSQFAPLVALGFFVREPDLLSPLTSRLAFSQATHTEYPKEALLEVWVSMLVGCRSIWQINPKIRPDLVLAQAWGRAQFAEQSTVARVLDEGQAEQGEQLRQGIESLYRWLGQAPQPPWAAGELLIDIDLTGLPAGRKAQGSRPGYFSGKKGPAAGSYVGSGPPLRMKVWPPCCIRATP